MQSKDKTGNSLKTMGQTIGKYLQITERGWNIPSYYYRDSNNTKERSPDLF